MEPSIHSFERQERKGRRFIALASLLAIIVISSAWVGLMSFLTVNTAYGTAADIEEEWIPDVASMPLDLPNLSSLSEVWTSDGVLLGKLSERNSQPTPYDEIPPLVVAAVLSAEDADFMTHPGIDFQAIVRAALADIRGGPTQGGSTITQQVVKQHFVGSEPTLRRKITEARIALEMERRYTKEQILEFYLNSVYFGWNAYGVTAAAQEYFGKSLDQLSVAEAATIPVPIRNPTLYDLRGETVTPLRARNGVIDEMAQEGYITEAEAEAAKREPLATIAHQGFSQQAPQVLIAAKDEVLNNPKYGLGATFLQRKQALFGCPAADTSCEGGGGLRITTTVDFGLQEAATDLLQDIFPPGAEGPTGAIAMVDNRTGATIVMASGLPFGEDVAAGQREYDLASKGRRPSGSAFKPLGLVAALENGFSLNSWWDYTTPQVLEFGGIEPWSCENAGPNPPGIRSLRDALVRSTNTVFCQLSIAVGPEQIVEVAHRMGVRSPLGDVPSIVLGTQSVSPLEMAAAYSTLANYGVKADNYLIERIEDADGNVIYQHRVDRKPVIERPLAAAVVDTMQRVVTEGTGGAASIGRPQGGKTGTHENHTDVWFVGFIPQYTTSVWVGFADGSIEMRNLTIDGVFYDRAFGGSVAAPIWRRFMNLVVEDLPVLDFPPLPEASEVYYETPEVEAPDLLAVPEDEVETTAFQAGLLVAIEEVPSLLPEGTVLSQIPPPGELVPQGTAITLEVSSGKPPFVEVPDLIGRNRAQADRILERLREDSELDFTWSYVERPVRQEENADIIRSTSPSVGDRLEEGDNLFILITVYDPDAFDDGGGGDGGDGDGGGGGGDGESGG